MLENFSAPKLCKTFNLKRLENLYEVRQPEFTNFLDDPERYKFELIERKISRLLRDFAVYF